MRYSADQREADITQINQALQEIRDDRGGRYANSYDCLANIRSADPEGSWRGAWVSAQECMNRLKNMFMQSTENQDIVNFENATGDLINFAYFIKLLGRQKRVRLRCDCVTDKEAEDLIKKAVEEAAEELFTCNEQPDDVGVKEFDESTT